MTEPKARPLIFSAPMVRALLEGRKTQTRRIVEPAFGKKHPILNLKEHGREGRGYSGRFNDHASWGYPYAEDGEDMPLGDWLNLCPHGVPGDLIWVRETCRAEELKEEARDGVRYLADNHWRVIKNTEAAADAWCELYAYRGKRGLTVSPIHMPRWASRLTLKITGVRVERLQDIGAADAACEGLVRLKASGRFALAQGDQYAGLADDDARIVYSRLWDQINGAGAWELNPWVWAITFEVFGAG